jgi:hypothetical protein
MVSYIGLVVKILMLNFINIVLGIILSSIGLFLNMIFIVFNWTDSGNNIIIYWAVTGHDFTCYWTGSGQNVVFYYYGS